MASANFRGPEEWDEWTDWLSAGLHGRNSWRLGVLLSGVLFALGRRTVSTWLRAAGVSLEDRRDLMGHKGPDITTHYSAAEIGRLFAAANRIETSHESSTPTLRRVIESTRKSLVERERIEPCPILLILLDLHKARKFSYHQKYQLAALSRLKI